MSEPAASRRASGQEPLLGIGQVLAKLQPEFPDLTPSKLRFLEDQQLVRPSRTASGYRKFSSADVERLTVVLSMQRDLYLPLKVIRTHLDAVDTGETPALPTAASAAAFTGGARRYTRGELASEAGAPPALIGEAVSAGLLPAAERYGDETLGVLRALVSLRSIGIEPRHLRSLRLAAEREAELVEHAIAPSRRADAAGKARLAERALEHAAHLATVHASVVRESLRRLGR